jgi:2-keto-3-deoxy-L-rhamnonate aldolase RhmA
MRVTDGTSVPGHDHASIGFALDAGASIVVPQVDTAEQAKKIVAAAKFGASIGGKRSAPPSRWLPQSSMQSCNSAISFWENQNLQAALIVQIESLEGINNLDAILTDVGEHIDSVWLGSLDLRVSMGLPGFWGQEPEWVSALNTFRSVLEKHDKPYSGLATGDDEWLKIRGEGRSVMFVASDLEAILRTRDDLARIRKLFPKNDYSTKSLENGVCN